MVPLGFRPIFGFAVCIPFWKPNVRLTVFFVPSTVPLAIRFGKCSGNYIAIVVVLGVMSPVGARSLLDTVVLLRPKFTSMVGGVANVLGRRLM